jgi:polyisoprenoid-binding protein YceI
MKLAKPRIIASGLFVLTVGLLVNALAESATADNYQVDSVNSFVIFRIKHMGLGYAYGRFDELSGSFLFNEADPQGITFDFTANAESVNTGNPKRDQHLKGPDFFNAREFPKITFKSLSVKRRGEKAFDVSGDLEMHGIAKPVSFTLDWVGTGKDPKGNVRSGFDGSFIIKRSAFGVNFGLDGGLSDEVQVTLAFEGIKK